MAMKEKDVSNFRVKYGRCTSYFGFTQTPNLLIRERKALGLTKSEASTLSYLMSYGSALEIADHICPSLKEMSKKTGLSPTTIHEAKDGLVTKGFIKIFKEKNIYGTNLYDLFPVREKLEKLAMKKILQLHLDKKIAPEKYDWLIMGKPP